MGAALTPDEHRARAVRHATVGKSIFTAGDEWSAVCYFYAAYHHVRAALLEDPIFDSEQVCMQRHIDLRATDRYTSQHRGRKDRSGMQSFGVNDLVLLLYRPVSKSYETLHQMSIQVRYENGLPSGSLDALAQAMTEFLRAVNSGALSSGMSPSIQGQD